MKTLTSILAAFVLVLGLAVGAQAQTSITTTTLSAAITNASPTTITITVASATGMAANGILYIDGSVYRIQSVSGTTITVSTVYRPATHLTSATVYIVPVAAQMGLNPVGSCIRGTAGAFPAYSPYTLMFNLSTGDVGACRGSLGSRIWVLTNPYSVGAASNNPPQTY